jgi:asparagine synthase (glutamine-hydrolysing)
VSGIAGIFRRDGSPAAAGDIAPALAALARRGPDRQASWCGGPAALACAQLRTTPQSTVETLPYHDRERGVVVVHDARLDNREELAGMLGLSRQPLAEVCDGALLGAAWTRWGERCPERLLGDFAFAVWDERNRTLFSARDHLGARALFCFASPRLFAFASEMKGLLLVPGVPRRLNPTRVADYLVGVTPDDAITFYADVTRFLPGESRLVAADRLATRRYYQPTLPAEFHRGGPEEVAAGFREVFTASVRDRLRVSRPVAAQLSGGLDSSSIVCVARSLRREARGGPLPTFSYVFPRTVSADERAYISAVAAEGGIEPHFVDADAITPLTDLDAILGAIDEPFRGAPLPYQWSIFRAAAERGVGVMLDGFGGDAVVGYGLWYLAELARSGRVVRLARLLRGMARRQWIPPGMAIRNYVIQPNIPAWARAVRRALLGRTARLPAPMFVAPELARRTALGDRFEAFWHSRPAPRGDHEHHVADVAYHLPKDHAEMTGAAFAIEPRTPFLDRRVVEYCLAVPSDQKIADGMTRMLPRRALADTLTPAVAARAGKAAPTASLLRGLLGTDLPRIAALFEGENGERVARYVDLPALRGALRRQTAAVAGSFPVWPTAEQWQAADRIRDAAVLIRWLRLTAIDE